VCPAGKVKNLLESENFAGKVAKSEKFEPTSEKMVHARRKSEKFKPKVRNWSVRGDKVRNSSQK
jgi:hypothetical protein